MTLQSKLVDALLACGFLHPPSDGVDRVVSKLDLLKATGRYGRLLSAVWAANDRANLEALMVEATFAWHFESLGKPLDYEVKQGSEMPGSVDFRRKLASRKEAFIEMRLVRQSQAISDLFESQLRDSVYFGTTLDGAQDRNQTTRMQGVIFEKAVDKNGRPRKFLMEGLAGLNLIAVDISEVHLGMVDQHDCLLVGYGDPAVDPMWRRQIFGLFQDPDPSYPVHIQEIAGKFLPFRSVVHGLIFLKRAPQSPVDFELEFFFLPNRGLSSEDDAIEIAEELEHTMKRWGPRLIRG